MKMRALASLLLLAAAPLAAQEPRQISDGVFVYAAKETDSNVNIILTREGTVLIDTGVSLDEGRKALAVVKRVAPQPVRYIIHTEPHSDHVVADFLYAPAATVIAASGAGASIARNKPPADPAWRAVLPEIEYRDRMTLNVGGRTFELMHLKGVHSEADTGVWMPQLKIMFAAATVGVGRYPNIRPEIGIPDILAGIRQMKALNPEIVVAGHGPPGTAKILDDMERYYTALLQRTGELAAKGRTLEQVKAEIRMPESENWEGKDRFGTNVDAAWRTLNRK